jgi:hypothetical protein
MKENVHISNFVIKNFIGQIQCQNARIKIFDSSLTSIDMCISEHFIPKDNGVTIDIQLVMSKNNIFGCSSRLWKSFYFVK